MIALLLTASFARDPIPATIAPLDVRSQELIPGVAPGEAPDPDEVDPRARALGRSLRCPVCQGANITDSPAKPAKAMFERTRQLLAAGYDEQQITDYFVDKYGEFILLDPQNGGLNTLLFAGPALGVGIGLALAFRSLVTWRRDPDDVAAAVEDMSTLDSYEQRLLAELNADDR